jgi:hypothetical protein
MEMPRVAVGRFEARAPFSEINLPREAAIDHPLERAIHRRTADTGMLAPDEIEKIVSAEMTFLFQEGPQYLFAFG